MHLGTNITVGAALILVLAGTTRAQNERVPQEHLDHTSGLKVVGAPSREKLDTLIGAKVSLEPSMQARAEAEEKGKEAKHPEGKVKDFIVKAGTGQLCGAVVSVGGLAGIGDKVVAIPTCALQWRDDQDRFTTDVTKEQLERLTEFDLDAAKAKGLDVALSRACNEWNAVVSEGKPEEKDADARSSEREAQDKAEQAARTVLETTKFRPEPVAYVLASELDDNKVADLDGDFGKVKDVIVDMNDRTVESMLVSHGGVAGIGDTIYVIPRESLIPCKSGDESRTCIPHPRAALERAVVYHEPEHGVLSAEQAVASHEWCAREMERGMKDRGTAKSGGR